MANILQTVGRRKQASARVRIEKGDGTITVNGKNYAEYFAVPIWAEKVVAPLKTVGKEKEYSVSVKVAGGGVHGQAVSVQHGIARALVELDEALKPALKAEGFLTRDSRSKERKKAGFRKARRGRQWRKR